MKHLLSSARKLKNLKTREVAQYLGVDQSLVSKFESGVRIPTEKQLEQLAAVLSISRHDLFVAWLKEKILLEVKSYSFASDAISLVQEELHVYNTNKRVFTPSITDLLSSIDTLKSQLDSIRENENFRITQALELEYTFESNRIEGNTLTLQETDLVVNEGITISGKSLREHLEAVNHKDAIEFMKELIDPKTNLRERDLLCMHNLILRGIIPQEAGKYRKLQVMISGSDHLPPQPYLVPKQMEDYFLWYSSNKDKLHPVVLAAEMHEKLVTVHPFLDGNGRTARLIMNTILLQNGYVIANIKGDSDSRKKYYAALQEVQLKKSKEAFIEFVATVELTSLERYLSILG